jgi:PAS domain S-box-containing protein
MGFQVRGGDTSTASMFRQRTLVLVCWSASLYVATFVATHFYSTEGMFSAVIGLGASSVLLAIGFGLNDSFTRMTGFRIDEVVGKKTSDLLYFAGTNDNTVRAVREAFAAVRGIRFEIQVRSKDGREWWLDTDAQPLLNEHGELRGWACIQSDVTSEVGKREIMRRDQSRILMMIHGGNIGTWEWDSASGLIEANSVFLEALGYARDVEPRTLEWWQGLHHEDDRDRILRGWVGRIVELALLSCVPTRRVEGVKGAGMSYSVKITRARGLFST